MALRAEGEPPGAERPLLLDAGGEVNPVEHLVHVPAPEGRSGPERWRVQPRNGSPLGFKTIEVCELNRREILELRSDHVCRLKRDLIDDLSAALRSRRREDVRLGYQRALRLLEPATPYLGLTYDALRTLVPDERLRRWCEGWPSPAQVGLPADPHPPPVARQSLGDGR